MAKPVTSEANLKVYHYYIYNSKLTISFDIQVELEYKTNPPEAFLADFRKLLEKYPEISVQLHIDEPAAAGSNGKYYNV